MAKSAIPKDIVPIATVRSRRSGPLLALPAAAHVAGGDVTPQPADGVTLHAHRWRIASPDGPTSDGGCACGAERAFKNAWVQDTLTAGAWDLHGLRLRGRPQQSAPVLNQADCASEQSA